MGSSLTFNESFTATFACISYYRNQCLGREELGALRPSLSKHVDTLSLAAVYGNSSTISTVPRGGVDDFYIPPWVEVLVTHLPLVYKVCILICSSSGSIYYLVDRTIEKWLQRQVKLKVFIVIRKSVHIYVPLYIGEVFNNMSVC